MTPLAAIRSEVDQFFESLYRSDYTACRLLLDSLATQCAAGSPQSIWRDYMAVILQFSTTHDSGSARQRLQELVAQAATDLELQSRLQLALGRIYKHEGDLGAAIASYRQTLAIAEQLHWPLEQVKAWNNIATCLERGFWQGEYGAEVLETAAAQRTQALKVLDDLPQTTETRRLAMMLWNGLGLVHRDLGQLDAALQCHEHDLALSTTLGDSYNAGLAHGNLGEIYYLRGPDWRQTALDHYLQALAAVRDHTIPQEEIEVLANLAWLYQQWLQPEIALDYYRAALERIEQMRLGSSTEEGRIGYFSTVVSTYANSVLLCCAQGRWDEAFLLAERARSRAFLDLLATRDADASASLAAAPISLAQVQQTLPPDAVLLEYFTTGSVDAGLRRSEVQQGIRRHRSPPAKTLLFVVTATTITVHDLRLSPNDLRPSSLSKVSERYFLSRPLLKGLYQQLLAPVAALAQTMRSIYIIPHGVLHYVPFLALRDEEDNFWLQPSRGVCLFAPSASILLRLPALAAPAFPCKSLALGYNGAAPAQLLFAEAEASAVAQALQGDAWIGPAPKQQDLLAHSSACQIIHLACHGEFDPEDPLASALLVGPGECLTAAAIAADLWLNSDLVVLSSCESGLSLVRRGDELLGLVRALFAAGAKALIVSLWLVDDLASWLLFREFYTLVKQGHLYSAALHLAQARLRQFTRRQVRDLAAANDLPAAPLLTAGPDDELVFADPYYWAGFIYYGRAH